MGERESKALERAQKSGNKAAGVRFPGSVEERGGRCTQQAEEHLRIITKIYRILSSKYLSGAGNCYFAMKHILAVHG